MNGRVFCVLSSVAILALSALGAQAEDSRQEAQKTCTEKDVLGTFVLMQFSETPGGDALRKYNIFKNQYLAFYPEHTYAELATNIAVTSPTVLDNRLNPNGRQKNNNKYVLDDDGTLGLYKGNSINYVFTCIVNLIPNGDYLKGDLLLTRFAEEGRSQISTLYRRWY
jgi:hypothetical protein